MNESPDVERETMIAGLERENEEPSRDQELEDEERSARGQGTTAHDDGPSIGDEISSEQDIDPE
jgi:hypothetical protein